MHSAKTWFYRLTAVHFLVTAVTGILLYFRAGNGRPGLYADATKEILVMIHNGEWISHLLAKRPFISGIAIGGALAYALCKFAVRGLVRSLGERTIAPVTARPVPPVPQRS